MSSNWNTPFWVSRILFWTYGPEICIWESPPVFPHSSVVKYMPANAEDSVLIPESGRYPGRGHDNPLQYSCLQNPMDRGAWWATVLGITKSQTWLKRLSTHVCMQVSVHTPWISKSWEEKKNVQYLICISILFTCWNNMLPILGQIKVLVNTTSFFLLSKSSC